MAQFQWIQKITLTILFLLPFQAAFGDGLWLQHIDSTGTKAEFTYYSVRCTNVPKFAKDKDLDISGGRHFYAVLTSSVQVFSAGREATCIKAENAEGDYDNTKAVCLAFRTGGHVVAKLEVDIQNLKAKYTKFGHPGQVQFTEDVICEGDILNHAD